MKVEARREGRNRSVLGQPYALHRLLVRGGVGWAKPRPRRKGRVASTSGRLLSNATGDLKPEALSQLFDCRLRANPIGA